MKFSWKEVSFTNNDGKLITVMEFFVSPFADNPDLVVRVVPKDSTARTLILQGISKIDHSEK